MSARLRPRLTIDVVTLFPKMFDGPLTESLIGRASQAGVLDIRVHSLRRWAEDVRHLKVDDRPYGGGAGMLIQPEPVYRAIKELGGLKKSRSRPTVLFLSPQGKVFNQPMAKRLARKKKMILLCGHYEGIDARVLDYVDEEVSIGDFVLTGGEIPALVLIDAVARLVPGVVGDPISIEEESFSQGLLEHSHYTRPARWRGKDVPDVLLSGNHQAIARWRREQSLARTKKKRPDLLK